MKLERRVYLILEVLKKLFPNIGPFLNFSNPWEVLVAVILSAQCTDERVNLVTKNLFKKYKKIEDYANADVAEFQKDIFSTGFYKSKTRHILSSASIIIHEFNGQVPSNMNDLLKLSGVGRKTANVLLYQAFGKQEGIAVDTHVKRLTQLLGLTKNQDPIKIEKDLIKILPNNEWGEFSLRLIAYGRKYCSAKKHDHKNCPLNFIA
jgi:endonuclease-3